MDNAAKLIASMNAVLIIGFVSDSLSCYLLLLFIEKIVQTCIYQHLWLKKISLKCMDICTTHKKSVKNPFFFETPPKKENIGNSSVCLHKRFTISTWFSLRFALSFLTSRRSAAFSDYPHLTLLLFVPFTLPITSVQVQLVLVSLCFPNLSVNVHTHILFNLHRPHFITYAHRFFF